MIELRSPQATGCLGTQGFAGDSSCPRWLFYLCLANPLAAQRPNRSNEWVREWLDPNGDIPEGTELFETAHMLRTLFAENGEVQPYFVMSSPKLPRDVGTSPLRDDLGPQGTELVYISTIWIDEVVRTLRSMC